MIITGSKSPTLVSVYKSFLSSEENYSKRKHLDKLYPSALLEYRKLPLISPGLIQLRKGFRWAYKRRGLYPGGGGGLITGIKNRFETSYSSVNRNTKYVKLRPVNSPLYSNTTVKQLKSYFNGILK